MKIITLCEDRVPHSSNLKVERGMSLYIEADGFRLLFDTGSSGLFMENAKMLGVPLDKVDGVIISHGHYDHANGLVPYKKEYPEVPFYIHKDALETYLHYYPKGYKFKYAGAVIPRDSYSKISIDPAIKDLPKKVIVEGNVCLFNGIREKGDKLWAGDGTLTIRKLDADNYINIITDLSGSYKRNKKNEGLVRLISDNVDVNKDLTINENTGLGVFPEDVKVETKEDDFSHEMALSVCENGVRALIVGCSHNGIVNTLKRYKSIYACYPNIVVGGFHLSNDFTTKEDIEEIREIGEFLKSTGALFYTGHCTTRSVTKELKKVCGEMVKEFSLGQIIMVPGKSFWRINQ